MPRSKRPEVEELIEEPTEVGVKPTEVGKENDMVNHPSHYNQGKIEVIDFIEDQKFDFHTGTAIRYLCRAGHKWNEVEDLEKAIWYINRRIQNLKNKAVEEAEDAYVG